MKGIWINLNILVLHTSVSMSSIIEKYLKMSLLKIGLPLEGGGRKYKQHLNVKFLPREGKVPLEKWQFHAFSSQQPKVT